MAKKKQKRELLGFKQAFTYVLDLLCYAYYVKNNPLISDIAFDELERVYMKIFNEPHAPMRAMERQFLYSNGVQAIYDLYFKEKNNDI